LRLWLWLCEIITRNMVLAASFSQTIDPRDLVLPL
jgi:hypothetical protein